jgi:CheY-like chemotaxis protein
MPHLLVIDDNPVDTALVYEAFGEIHPEVYIRRTPSGAQALEHLRLSHELPDLILLDLNMPGMNGLDVLAQIKSTPRLRDVPTVILTSSKNPQDLAAAMHLRPDGYLVKPILWDEFVELVQVLDRDYLQGRPRGFRTSQAGA